MVVKLVIKFFVMSIGPSNCKEADTADRCELCDEGYDERFWTNGVLFQICERKLFHSLLRL